MADPDLHIVSILMGIKIASRATALLTVIASSKQVVILKMS